MFPGRPVGHVAAAAPRRQELAELARVRVGLVVQPVVVDAVMKHIQAVMGFDRRRSFYTCDMEISDFTGPAQGR